MQSGENISSNIHRMKSFGKKSLELHHLKSFTPRLSPVDLKKAEKKTKNRFSASESFSSDEKARILQNATWCSDGSVL